MDEKNLENEMQEQAVSEQQLQEEPAGQSAQEVQPEQTEQSAQEAQLEQAEQPAQEAQPEQAEQPAQEAQPEQAEQPVQEEEELGQTDKLTRPEQPVQDPQTFQQTYNAYGDVMGATPTVSNETPAPKKKGLKIALISVICAAVVAIVGLVVFLVTKKTPEEVVRLAVTNTVDELEDTDFNIYEDVFGMSEYNMDDIDMEMTFSVDEVLDMVELNGSSISVEASAQTNESGTTDFDILSQLTIAGKALDTNLYCIQDILYLEMPEILDSVISLDMSDIDLSEYAVPETEEDREIEELYDTYMIPAKEALEEAITYEKGDKVKITNHNGEKVSTTQYTMTVPVRAVKDYIQTECDYLIECADKYLTDEEVQSALGMSRDEFKQIVTLLPNYFSFFFTRDFVFNFYIHDKKLVRTEYGYKFTILGASLDVSVDFMGDDHVLSDVYAICDITLGDEAVSLVGEYTQDGNSEGFNKDVSFDVIYEDAEVFSYNFNQNYDASSELYSEKAVISDITGVSNSTIEVQGRIYDVEKGESFRADLDSITVSYRDTELVRCSAKFAMGNLAKDIAEPDYSNVTNFNEIDDAILEDLIDTDKLDEIFNEWSAAFGLDGIGDSNYYEESIYDDLEFAPRD